MLMPKRVKYRKYQRGRRKGVAVRGSRVSFGECGLQALSNGWLTNVQIEACRVSVMRALKGSGKLWIYFTQSPLFDNTPTMEALEGSGLEPPRVEEYFINLFDYCKRTNWGRNRAAR